MRTERILAVADAIEAHPEHFDMEDFCRVPNEDAYGGYRYSDVEDLIAPEFVCGTTACIGGWAVHLYPEEAAAIAASGRRDPADVAKEILGLDTDDIFYADPLFDYTAEEVATWLRWYALDPTSARSGLYSTSRR